MHGFAPPIQYYNLFLITVVSTVMSGLLFARSPGVGECEKKSIDSMDVNEAIFPGPIICPITMNFQ